MAAKERNRLIEAIRDSYRIEWTDSIEQAKSWIDEGKFEALILDEDLPAPGWTALTQQARKSNAALPILICTSEVGGKKLFGESRKDDTYIADVLVKPYSEEVVTRRVAAAVAPSSGKAHTGATLPSHPLETGSGDRQLH